MKKYTADFEATTTEEDCRVWAYGICEIGDESNFIYGNSIDWFIEWCKKNSGTRIYFHNLKFDGEFIISYLLENGYEHITDKKERKDRSFRTLISELGAFYSIEIYFKVTKSRTKKVVIYDSLKILNFKVDKIAKEFNLPIRKLKIDYKAKREKGHKLTEEEKDYLRNDVEIMARALDIMFNEGLTKMTIGSNALNNYKELNRHFRHYFPELAYEVDKDIRRGYKGGFTYLNKKYEGKETDGGIVLDVNSLYPSVMKYNMLPVGEPVYFEGKYQEDKLHKLYIQSITCIFELKPGKIPTIQIRDKLEFMPNEYVESSKGEYVTLILTNIDLKLFFEHYDIKDIHYNCGWKFKGLIGLFNSYIDYWSKVKIESKKNGNRALYQIAKLMLNSLYGKFGKNPVSRSKIPYLDNGIVRYKITKPEIGKSVYVPVAMFITSYGRDKVIRTSQKIRDYSLEKYGKDLYVYSDTDSIHCLIKDGKELEGIVEIDEYKLGAWDEEFKFKRGKYLRQKCYIEEGYDNKMNIRVAGLPTHVGKVINFDNFDYNFSTTNKEIKEKIGEGNGKLVYKHVKGGVILVETDFTIK